MNIGVIVASDQMSRYAISCNNVGKAKVGHHSLNNYQCNMGPTVNNTQRQYTLLAWQPALATAVDDGCPPGEGVGATWIELQGPKYKVPDDWGGGKIRLGNLGPDGYIDVLGAGVACRPPNEDLSLTPPDIGILVDRHGGRP